MDRRLHKESCAARAQSLHGTRLLVFRFFRLIVSLSAYSLLTLLFSLAGEIMARWKQRAEGAGRQGANGVWRRE